MALAGRIILAIVVGVIAALICLLVGTLLVAVQIPVPILESILVALGNFLIQWAWVIGLLNALIYFVRGPYPTSWRP